MRNFRRKSCRGVKVFFGLDFKGKDAIALFVVFDIDGHHEFIDAEIKAFRANVGMNRLMQNGTLVNELLEVQFFFHVPFIIGARDKGLVKNRIATFVFSFHGLDVDLVTRFDADCPDAPICVFFNRKDA